MCTNIDFLLLKLYNQVRYISVPEPTLERNDMHPVQIIFLSIVGIIAWVFCAHYVNEELDKLNRLHKEEELHCTQTLKVPNLKVLRCAASKKGWVIAALVISPVLVIIWGMSIIVIFLLVLLPMFLWEIVEDIAYSLRQFSR